MIWMICGAVFLVILGLGSWLFAPTIRALLGPSFEPASKDEASIVRAQQSANSAGAGE
jgi:hypothetical protein